MPKNQSSAVISKSQLSFLRARLKMKGSNRFNPRHASMAVVANLHQPMAAALAEENKNARSVVIDAIYQHIVRTGKFYGSWTRKQWVNCYRMALPRYKIERATQTFVFAAYKLAGLVLSKEICSGRHRISLVHLCRKLYGEQVDLEMARLIAALLSTGYAERGVVVQLPAAIAELMLWLEEPELDKWRDPIIRAREIMRPNFQGRLHAISVGLNVLGIVKEPIAFRAAIGFSPNVHYKPKTGIDPAWVKWVETWEEHSVLGKSTTKRIRAVLYGTGRWLNAEHPSISSPAQWDTALAAKYVKAVSDWKVGDYIDDPPVNIRERMGEKMLPRSMMATLSSVRTFFANLQDLELIPIKFSPRAALRCPTSIKSQAANEPRVLADDVWAKLLYAGIMLKDDQVAKIGLAYPVELIRAIAINWLFDGMRNDEIHRLHLDCIRREPEMIDLLSGEVTAASAEILVPANKYTEQFFKPIDPVVADAIDEWKARRPQQPKMLDRKTGRYEDRLFAFRGKPVGKQIINMGIIPLLCDLAGVPSEDAIGRITSHRARSTIASQLLNADTPMTLFDIRDWLGHKKVESLAPYVKRSKSKRQKAYREADYFRGAIGRIPVLLDQEAISSGAAGAGKPYLQYDLGHGYCGNKFYSKCAHRMACVRCSYYTPKESEKGRLIESSASNLKLLEEVPLRAEEIDAAKGDAEAVQRLIDRLHGVPTPDMVASVR